MRDEELSVMGAAVNPAPMTDWQRAELRRVWEASLRRRHPGCAVVFERNTPENVDAVTGEPVPARHLAVPDMSGGLSPGHVRYG